MNLVLLITLVLGLWWFSRGDYRDASAAAKKLNDDLERERVRLAGCSVAALGDPSAWEVKVDDYAYSASLSDVRRLYDKHKRALEESDRLQKLNGSLSTLLGEVREKLSQEQVRLKRMEREIGVPAGTTGNDTMETRVEARGQDVRVKIANLEKTYEAIAADNERLRADNKSLKARVEEAEARIANALA